MAKKLVIFDKHGVQRDPKKLSETNGELDEIVVKLFEATGPVLVLCEGIETALAVHAATGLPVWATLSTNNYAGVVIPDHVSTVLFFADRDLPVIPTTPNGREMPLGAGHWWASAAAKNLEASGKTCHVLLSPELPEQEKTDWLDAWNVVGVEAFDLEEIAYVYGL